MGWRIIISMGAQADFVARQHVVLLRAAYLLTGDATTAQDLVQETLVRVIVAWHRVQRADEPDAYARRILLTTFLAGQRRHGHREQAYGEPPEAETGPSPFAAVEDHDVLRRALMVLPVRQRTAVVLRHYEDLSEVQTAELLGCSVGTVKSLTSRGFAALRTTMSGRALS